MTDETMRFNNDESSELENENNCNNFNSFDSDVQSNIYGDNSEEIVLENVPVENEEEKTREKENKKKRIIKIAGTAVCAVLVGAIAGGSAGLANAGIKKLVNSKINIATTQTMLTKSESQTGAESEVADIVEQCMPSVVSISNKSVTEVMTFFGTYAKENVSSGSGIIIGKNDTELLIVTNYHVVADSQELSVLCSDVDMSSLTEEKDGEDGEKIANDEILKAQVKGYDSDKDLAVISVKLDSIPTEVMSKIRVATIGDSSKVRMGEKVVAIGNALGYGQSVTDGIISATNREVTLESQTMQGGTVTNKFIQTNAAINPGNSGGALLNMKGELIGINSVKIASSGVEGMGYAIPISDVESIIGELMVRETRDVVDEDKQGYLGVIIKDVSSDIAQAYDMPQGVYVSDVTEGSAADKAGIKKGYIITKFDGYTIKSSAELQERLSYYKAGEKTKITVSVRGEDEYTEKELDIKLGSKKEAQLADE